MAAAIRSFFEIRKKPDEIEKWLRPNCALPLGFHLAHVFCTVKRSCFWNFDRFPTISVKWVAAEWQLPAISFETRKNPNKIKKWAHPNCALPLGCHSAHVYSTVKQSWFLDFDWFLTISVKWTIAKWQLPFASFLKYTKTLTKFRNGYAQTAHCHWAAI